MAAISVVLVYKGLKIAQIVQIYQLFRRSNQFVPTVTPSMANSYANEQKFKHWRQLRLAYVNLPPLPVSEVVLVQIWLVQRIWRTADSRVQMGWLGWLLTNEPWACLSGLHSPVFAVLVAFLHRLLGNRSSVGEEVRDKLKNIKEIFNWVS